jgi:hypothetical protein
MKGIQGPTDFCIWQGTKLASEVGSHEYLPIALVVFVSIRADRPDLLTLSKQRIAGARFLTRTLRQKWETTDISPSHLSFVFSSCGWPRPINPVPATNRGCRISERAFCVRSGKPRIFPLALAVLCQFVRMAPTFNSVPATNRGRPQQCAPRSISLNSLTSIGIGARKTRCTPRSASRSCC